MARVSFKEQTLRAREAAIIASASRLLAEKGFDAMTVDEVAADVGIAKASLYKHFVSKESLAAAAMVQVLDLALAQIERQCVRTKATPLVQLQDMVRWAMARQLAGDMPSLPTQNSVLRAALAGHAGYLDRVVAVSEQLGTWIAGAQAQGQIDANLPPELVLYTLFARACDPVLGFLRMSGQYSDERIIELVLHTCFQGLKSN
jgi:AcrR family transcriptional regulator